MSMKFASPSVKGHDQSWVAHSDANPRWGRGVSEYLNAYKARLMQPSKRRGKDVLDREEQLREHACLPLAAARQ